MRTSQIKKWLNKKVILTEGACFYPSDFGKMTEIQGQQYIGKLLHDKINKCYWLEDLKTNKIFCGFKANAIEKIEEYK